MVSAGAVLLVGSGRAILPAEAHATEAVEAVAVAKGTLEFLRRQEPRAVRRLPRELGTGQLILQGLAMEIDDIH